MAMSAQQNRANAAVLYCTHYFKLRKVENHISKVRGRPATVPGASVSLLPLVGDVRCSAPPKVTIHAPPPMVAT